MFFTKSETDLGNKSTVQHRVICDWLRNIDKKLTRIEGQVRALQREVVSIPADEHGIEREWADAK